MSLALIEPLESRVLLDGTVVDTAFGSGGRVTYGPSAPGRHGLVLLPDNGVIVTAQAPGARPELHLLRFNADGKLDPSFGDNGTRIVRWRGGQGYRSALQGQERLVVLNAARWQLQGFTLDGDRDGAFQSPRMNFRRADKIGMALAIGPDRGIVTVGSVGGSLAITRHTPDGRPDRTFSHDGRLRTRIELHRALRPSDIAVDPSGRILVRIGPRLLRFHADGRRDHGFGQGGSIAVGTGAFAIDPGGRIVAAAPGFIQRFMPDGSLDPAFGIGGFVNADLQGTPQAVFIRPSGEIHVAALDRCITVTRLGPDGVDLGRGEAIYTGALSGVAIDSAGRIVVSPLGRRALYRFSAQPFPQSIHRLQAFAGHRIEAEFFDEGGPEFAYHDLDRPNPASNARLSYVDIAAGRFGTHITNTRPGEWLEYTYDFRNQLTADVAFHLASTEGGGSFHLEIDGVDVTGPLLVPRTDAPDVYGIVVAPSITFPAGRHVLRLSMESAGPSGFVANFDAFGLAHSLIDLSFGRAGVAAVAPGLILARPDGAIVVVHSVNRLTLLDAGGQVIASHTGKNSRIPDQALLQPDWKILVVGERKLYRFNADLSPDLAFGEDGAVAASGRIALQPGGEIIVGGIGRYFADGQRDDSFSVPLKDLRLPERFGRHSIGRWSFLGASGNGNLYFAIESKGPDDPASDGYYRQVPILLDIARFDADGKLDGTYGEKGITELIFYEDWENYPQYFGARVLPDGSVLTGLERSDYLRFPYAGVLRVPPDGVRLRSVDTDGAYFRAEGFAVLPDGQSILRGKAVTDWPERGTYLGLRGGPWGYDDWANLFGEEEIQVIVFQEDGQLLIGTKSGLRRGAGLEPRPQVFNSRPWRLGERIEVEDFDTGGEGVGHRDLSPANDGGAYRLSTVDIRAVGDGFAIGHTLPGEWLQYTLQAAASGIYSLKLIVASAGRGGTFHVELNGADLTGPIQVPDTGSASAWREISVSGLSIPAGDHQVRLVMDAAGDAGIVGHFDWFRFDPAPPDQAPFHGTPFAIGQVIEAEHYDIGGYGIAFHDRDLAAVNAYRNDEVEVVADSDASNGWAVELQSDEWVEYTIQVDAPGSYLVDIRGKGEGTMVVSVGAGFVWPSFTGDSFQTGEPSALFIASPGAHIMRITASSGSPTLDSLRLTRGLAQLDASYDSDGISAFVPELPVAVDGDGRILVATREGLIRYNPDGSRGPTLAEDPPGQLSIFPYPVNNLPPFRTQFWPLSDGSYLWHWQPGWPDSRTLIRFNAAGERDQEFRPGLPQRSLVAPDPRSPFIYSASATETGIRIRRDTTSGQLDSTFGTDGQVLQALPDSIPTYRNNPRRMNDLLDISVQRSGRIIVVGVVTNGDQSFSVAAGFDSSGALDRTFGQEGWIIDPREPGSRRWRILHVRSDDALVIDATTEVLVLDTDGQPQRWLERPAYTWLLLVDDQIVFQKLQVGLPADAEVWFEALTVDPEGRLLAVGQRGNYFRYYCIFRFEPLAVNPAAP